MEKNPTSPLGNGWEIFCLSFAIKIHTMFDNTLLDILFLISMTINLTILVGLLIRPSLRTHLNIFLSCLVILNIIKIFLDFISR